MYRLSGIAYIIIFITGFYANFLVVEKVKQIKNYAELTAIQDDINRGVFGFIIMLLFDTVLIFSLYSITKFEGKLTAVLASVFRLFHAIFFSLGLYALSEIYNLETISSNTFYIALNRIINHFDFYWTVGLLFFSVHLYLLSKLVYDLHGKNRLLSLLLFVASIGYFLDSSLQLGFPNLYSSYENIMTFIVVIPAVLGELSFTLWLLYFGFSKKKI